MRPSTAGIACLALLALVLTGLGYPGAAKAQPGRFAIPSGADELLVVSSPRSDPRGGLAEFRLYTRSGVSSAWRSVLGPWPVETGYGGLRLNRHEGDGSTPAGVFGFGATIYGNRPNPGGLHHAYHHLVCGDWWDEDRYSLDYNRFVHVACGVTPSFAAGSEPLWRETLAYPYFAVIRFNRGPIVRGRSSPGSGIFLHSWVGAATAGCVALHETQLVSVLRRLRPAADPVIAIGTVRELRGILPGG